MVWPPRPLLLGLAGLCASALGAAAAEEAPAFLGSELPLRVLSVLPTSQRSGEAGTRIGGRAALTVVYSRAVIALGADWSDKGNNGKLPESLVPFHLEACEGQPAFGVPGKIRWSTTSIARFDTDVDWPSDLCFRLVPNANLRTFDGLALSSDSREAEGWRFTTRPVRMSLLRVSSERARELTGGRWTSETFGEGGSLPHECPPDATVHLSFSSDLDHDVAFQALQSANVEVLKDGAYEACGRRCLAVKPRGLEPGQPYELVFPEGARYGRTSGLSGSRQSVTLQGLVPFAFPFWFKTPPAHSWENRKLRYRRHRLYLRHGLEATKGAEAAEAQLKALKGAITVTTADGSWFHDGASLDFEIRRIDNATLQLEVFALAPGKRYKLEVQASDDVRDGFGQALQAGAMEYETDGWPDGFVMAEESPAYFRRSPGSWTVLAGGEGNSWCARPASGPGAPLPPQPVPPLPAEVQPPPMPQLAPMQVQPPPVPQLAPMQAQPPPLPLAAAPARLRSLRSEDCVRRPYELRAWPVGAGDLPAALAQRHNQRQTFLAPTAALEATAPLTNELKAVELGENHLLLGSSGENRSGLFLRELQKYQLPSQKGFVSVAPFGVAFVATATGELLVWASGFASGEAVAGARVTVYRLEKTYNTQLTDITLVAGGTTGADGLAVLSPPQSWHAPGRSYAELVAAVQGVDGALAFAEAVPAPWQERREEGTRAELVTDRSIYRPGDTVHVKGYVRVLDAEGTGYALPEEAEASFAAEVVWKRHGPGHGDAGKVRVEAPLVARYGSVAAELRVPESDEEVTYGDVQISLLRIPTDKSDKPASVASAGITVADPRPPTVTLNISTDAKVVLPGPAASLDVAVHTATYSGSAVEGAKVELSWHLRRAHAAAPVPRDGVATEVTGMAGLIAKDPANHGGGHEDHEASGKLTVVTGRDGKGTAVLALASLLDEAGEDGGPAPACGEGDELAISARWVGPTREVVTAKLEGGPLPVARSEYALGLTPTRPVDTHAGTPLPGTPLAVYVDLRGPGGVSEEGTEVTLSLHEWDGSASLHESPTEHVSASASKEELQKAALRPGLVAVDKWGSQVGGTCAAEADGGKKAQCASTLTLPEAKKYVVLARARDPQGVELVTAFAVGRTPSEWKKRPLASLDTAVTVRTDKSSYALGDVAKLSMVSPFQDATVLVAWGNGKGRRTKQQKLEGAPGAEHVLELGELGGECAYGCNALVLLAAPDQPRGVVLPVEVEVSPLLDVTLPRTVVKHVRIDVPDTQRAFAEAGVELSVAVGGEPVEVVRPGDEAEVQVSMPESDAGSEVCVFVVDKAMLDVGGAARPHPVAELARRFELRRGDRFLAHDTFASLASDEGYRQTVATALRRAKLDPWAFDLTWPLRPQTSGSPAPVELSDEDYFADHTDDATHFPGPPGLVLMGDMGLNGGLMPMMAERAMPMALAAESVADEAPMAKSAAMPAPAPAPPPTTTGSPGGHRGKGGGRGGGSLGKAAFTRSQFETTPLFKASAVVGSDGKVSVPLKVPDNIATFEVRAYVVDGAGKHKFGHAETSFVSRRPVSLVPSLPRVVRPGDRFECGVTVTGHVPQEAGGMGLPEGGVAVLAQVLGKNASVALRLDEMAAFKASQDGDGLKRSLSSTGNGGSPQEVIFPFQAPSARGGGRLGAAALRFGASLASGEPADGLEAKLTVKAQQAPVHVATSLSIAASSEGSSEAVEGLQLPEAMPGSGELALTAGVGYLPAVVANSGNLLGRHMNNGQVLVASLVPAAALAAYAGPGGESASAGLDSAAAAFGAAIGRLPAFTEIRRRPPLGLLWRADEGHGYGGRAPVASVAMNSFGLLIAQLISELGGASERKAPKLAVPMLLTSTWRGALEGELKRQVLDLHFHSRPPCTSRCFRSWGELAQARAALGFAWRPSSAVVAEELQMERLFSEEALDSLGPLGLAHAALAYTLHTPDASQLPAEAAARLADVYDRLVAQFRVQGRTAYVAATPESQHSAGLEANAVVLLALARAGATALSKHFADNAGASLAAKLAAYVADGAGAGHSMRFGGGEWMSSREAALAAAALAMFDIAHGSARPDLELSASSGAVNVLEYEAREPGTPPTSATLPWDQLPQPPKPLRFEASGSGQVSIVAAMTFVPASAPTEGAVYRGLYVEKVVRRMDATGKATGPALDFVRLGESVVVTIQVTTPDDLERVTLQDLSAGGLEPVDPKVAGDEAGSDASGGCNFGFVWSWWCLPAFSGRETYADRVTWSSGGHLPAGTHTVSYQAVAATRGVFALPPAHAFVEDQPEVMGLSQAGTLVVLGSKCGAEEAAGAGEDTEESPDAVLQRLGLEPGRRLAPKGCPGGCPHGGVCRLATGTCGCYQGLAFIDGDCPAPRAAAEAVTEATRLFLRSSMLSEGQSAGLLGAAALPACGVLLLVAGLAAGWARRARCLGRGRDSVRFTACRDEPYTSMELMEQ